MNRISVLLMVAMFFVLNIATIEPAGAQNKSLIDSATLRKLMKSSRDSIDIDAKKTLQQAEIHVNIAREINYYFGLVYALNTRGYAKRRVGDPSQAVTDHKEAIRLAEKYNFQKSRAEAYMGLAGDYNNMGAYQEAFLNYTTAISVFAVVQDSTGIASGYMCLGNVQLNMKYYDDAIRNYTKAANMFNKIGLPLSAAKAYTSMAANYQKLNNHRVALSYLYRTLRISDSLHSKQELPIAYMYMGECYNELKMRDSAMYCFMKSYNGFKENGYAFNELRALYNIGHFFAGLNENDSSEKYYMEALILADKVADRLTKQIILKDLSAVFLKRGELMRAYHFRDSSANLQDSITNAANLRAIAELNTKFERKEIENKNSTLQKENDLQRLRLQRKDIFIYSSGIIIMLFLAFGALILRHNKLRSDQQRIQMEQKQLLAQMNPHFIFNCLNSIQRYIVQRDADNANRYLADFAMLMRQTLDNAKEGTISLLKEMEYLENYLSLESMRFANKFTYNITCSDDIEPGLTQIPSMIIQPFVENAIIHGLRNIEHREGSLDIRFYKKEDSLFCEVDDNGIGFNASKDYKDKMFIKHKSYGMELTRSRLALMSKMKRAEYKISVVHKLNGNQENDGTKIIVKLPLIF
ncbi:MAG: histidine kinase [Taibaiella sp.]|nr:histidine kinase [Taibaiella sp.]